MNAMLSGALGRLFRSVIAVSAVALLASCGGGERSVPFKPKRVLVFGDELSVIVDTALPSNGKKYTINADVPGTGATLVCQTNPIWTQVLAGGFGLVFPECNPGAVASPPSRIYARAGAGVAGLSGVTAQIDAHLAANEGGFTSTDLVTVLVGTHDLLAHYAAFDGGNSDEDAAVAAAEASGVALALQVNRIADAGGRVIIATTPDLGVTPFGLKEKADNTPITDIDRAALLSKLSARFNAKLRATIYNDGRRIGLILADELIQTFVKFPSSFGFVNVTGEACTVALPDCTSLTLQSAVLDGAAVVTAAATSTTWLWSDSLWIAPSAHSRLGQLAFTRATGNPF